MARQQRSAAPAMAEPVYVEEPLRARDYADVLKRAAAERRAVIVQRRGEAYAAIISLEHFELLQDALARQEAESIAAQIDWSTLADKTPPAEWLEGDEPKPF